MTSTNAHDADSARDNDVPTMDAIQHIIEHAMLELDVLKRLADCTDTDTQISTLFTVMGQCFEIGLSMGVADAQWGRAALGALHGEAGTDTDRFLTACRTTFIAEMTAPTVFEQSPDTATGDDLPDNVYTFPGSNN